MDNKSKQFKELKNFWYQKLKDSGFEDIEQDDSHLKWSPAQHLARTSNRDKEVFFEAKEDYYRLAGHFLYDHKFNRKADKIIWEYHVEGKTMRETVKLLLNHKIKMALTQVKESIHKTRAKMFNKYKELNNE